MPPKKSTADKKDAGSADKLATKATNDRKSMHSNDKKRKADTTRDAKEVPSKQQRRSGRGNVSKAAPDQLLNFLLSREADELTKPDDETEALSERGEIKTYSSTALNPFEELMCAIVLSRPISHRLGLRTIRTVLNDPYSFTSAKTLKKAGSDKQHQALWDARTQHKDKTAQQLGQLAEVVLDKFTASGDEEGKELGRVLKDNQGDTEKIRAALKSAITGLGATGLDIFLRRVQWLWDDIYPYIDARTVDALRRFSLPYKAQDLIELIDSNWKRLDTQHVAGSGDASKRRRAFVVILERVIGADLEGKVETVLNRAAG